MPTRPHVVLILAYDGVQLLDVTGPIEVFEAANERGADYRVIVASPDGRDVRTSARLRIGVDRAFADVAGPIGTLLVPGASDAPRHRADGELVTLVAAAAQRSRRVVSVCAGAFLLAEAGLLDGRRVTTHWELADTLAGRYPEVTVDADAIFVRDGQTFTSAGITAGIDLCLALVEADHGAQRARDVARHLVVFLQRPGGQAQFSARLDVPVASEPLRRVLDEMVADPRADLSIEALSESAGFSTRHLTRVFRRELGTTPGAYVERVRVEAAKTRLQEGQESLDVVAQVAGFGSSETMRRAFARELGTTPAGYRARFQTAGT